MLAKNSQVPQPADLHPRRYGSSGIHFMTNIFRKIETGLTQKRAVDPPKTGANGSPAKPQSRSRLVKKSMIGQTRDGRLNSCGKTFQTATPNSKSFDVVHKVTSSPDTTKRTFLLNQRKLKTILGKNLMDCRPKNMTPFPEPQAATKPLPKACSSKVSSARTSPQINKLRTPFIVKLPSKDKSHVALAADVSTTTLGLKAFQKSLLGELKQSRTKLFTKLSTKCNKENQKDDQNAFRQSDSEVTATHDLSRLRSMTQKNCIFEKFLGATQAAKEPPKVDANSMVFKATFCDKFNAAIFELHCSEVTGMRALLAGHGHPLDALVDGFVKSLKHPLFLEFSGELRPDSDLAKSFEFFLKQEVIFALFIVPLAHGCKVRTTASLTRAFDAVCFNLFCLAKTIKRHCKMLTRTSLADAVESAVRTTGLCPVERTPVKMAELVMENNTFLKNTIASFVEELKQPSLRKCMTALIRKTRDTNLFQFVSAALETFEPFFQEFSDHMPASEPDNVPHESGGRSVSSTSYVYEEEDPYFILQPLKIERYLPDKSVDEKPLTLVLDLDETLVHFTENENNGKFLVRPFAREFLLRLQNYYEIVVFTAALKDYADWILDRIDTGNSIRFRLYRDHTTFQNGVYLKDLSRLNRDLSKTVIVDNNPDNFQMHPENGIYIKSWYEDPNDLALKHLTGILIRVAESGEADIRRALATLNRRLAATREPTDK